MTTTNTYEVYFKIALYPEGIMYGEFVEDFEDFKKYLCSKQQSATVLEFFKNAYDIFGLADVTVRDVEFENNGKFNCKVEIVTEKYDEFADDDLEEIIETAIWPGFDAETIQIFIEGKALKMDLKIDYFVEGDDEEEENEEEDVEEENVEEEDDESSGDEKYKIYPQYNSSNENGEETEEEDNNCKEYN